MFILFLSQMLSTFNVYFCYIPNFLIKTGTQIDGICYLILNL